MKRFSTQNQISEKGFTIVELLIATAVFSVLLVLLSTAMIQIGRLYYKGITTTKTQETARQIIDEISRNIQFDGGQPPVINNSGTNYYFCVGDKRYTFIKDRQQKDTPAAGSDQRKNVLIVEQPVAVCSSSIPDLEGSTAPAGARELIAPNMRIAKLTIQPVSAVPPGNSTFSIELRIVYGDADLLNATHDNCRNVAAGTQFCTASELRTVVTKRL